MSIHQGGTTWNGSAWVQSVNPHGGTTPNAGGGTYSSYTYTQQQNAHVAPYHQYGVQTLRPAPVPLPSPFSPSTPSTAIAMPAASPPVGLDHKGQVEHYSRYYQYWTAQRDMKKKEAALLPPGLAKDEALRTVAWAEYYANQSAHAAHYYNNQISTTSQTQNPSGPPPPLSSSFPVNNIPPPSLSVSQTQQQQVPSIAEDTKKSNLDKYETKKSNLNSPSHLSEKSPNNHPGLQLSHKKKKKEMMNSNITHKKSIQSFLVETSEGNKKSSWGSKISKPNDDHYMNRMPENDSYYGMSKDSDSNEDSSKERSNFIVKKSYRDFLMESSNDDSKSKGRVSKTISADKSEETRTSSELHFPKKKKFSDFEFDTPSKKRKKSSPIEAKPEKKTLIAKTTKHATSKKVNNGFESSKKILAKRADRFSGKGGLSNSSNDFTAAVAPTTKLGQYMGLSIIGGGGGSKKSTKRMASSSSFGSESKELDYEKMTVKGTCQRLEKDFFRLTAPPQAHLVRPQPILQKHLKNLKKMWSKKETDYLKLCSQLKAIRQDLTVQRINNSFAVEVYETHARVALEQGDLNEYNQCQTQLKELYDDLERELRKNIDVHGDDSGTKCIPGLQNQNEFIAYRIIYYVYLTGNKKYDGGSSDLFKIMLSLTPSQKMDPCIIHALKGKSRFLNIITCSSQRSADTFYL